jgi:hypothetical protein
MSVEKKAEGIDANTAPTNKGDVDLIADVDLVESGSTSSQEGGFNAQQTKALIRKMDWALLPFLALLYLLSFLDRSTSFLPPHGRLFRNVSEYMLTCLRNQPISEMLV